MHIISLITTAFNIFQRKNKKYVKKNTSKKEKQVEISSGLPVGVLYETTQFPSSSDGGQFPFKKTDRTTVSDASGSKNNIKLNQVIGASKRKQDIF